MKKNLFYLIAIMSLLVSCSSNSDSNSFQNSNFNNGNGNDNNGNDNNAGNNSQEWLIPVSQVFDGGPGKDGIPSIDNPMFVNLNSTEANYLNDDDLVIGIVKGNEVKAYPHLILDWHEIINDIIFGGRITISYCPLTGTAFGWESSSNNQFSTFGVSGLLYNTNLILYDRNTNSNWSQLKLQCVNGPQIGDIPNLINIVETDWLTWKTNFPNTKVLSLNTGFSRPYGTYPYGDYVSNNEFILFPVSPWNTTLPSKERVHAIIDRDSSTSKVYQFSVFTDGKIIKEVINGVEYLIIGKGNLINSFKLTIEHSELEFNLVSDITSILFNDNEGNKWNIFGKAIEGPRLGEQLDFSNSVTSYWFAIAAFYPNPDIYMN